MMPAEREALHAQLERQIEILLAARRRYRREREGRDDEEDGDVTSVRELLPRHPSPRVDQIQVQPPDRYRLDVVGTDGGKATTETKQ